MSTPPITIAVATANSHKVAEIQAILGERYRCLPLREFPSAPQPVEDAPDFAGNAIKKALSLARWLASRRGPAGTIADYVLADDSGLEVDALNGAPGVRSARFAALDTGSVENSSDLANNTKLLRLLKDVPAGSRTARFRCVIAFTPVLRLESESSSPVCAADEAELQTETFEGVCKGRIIELPRGMNGFGYDPLFIPAGYSETFAELGDGIKNQLSHRAQALVSLKKRLSARGE